jgi:hypothetical protein
MFYGQLTMLYKMQVLSFLLRNQNKKEIVTSLLTQETVLPKANIYIYCFDKSA